MNGESESRQWVVYIVKCLNKSFYTGVTNNIKRRIHKHNSAKGGKYTRAFGPVKLLWTEHQPDKSSALKREAQLKNWSRHKKQALINGIQND